MSARVIAGSAGWYVWDPSPWEVDGSGVLVGPILAIEMAHEVAEEADAAFKRRLSVVADELVRHCNTRMQRLYHEVYAW